MWNGPINGDWSNVDFAKAPWLTGAIMTLDHEEVLHVQTECAKIIDEFKASNDFTTPVDEYVVPRYNESDWEKCINGDTYAVIKQYDPEVNTLGINENGIIMPEETPVEEEAAKEGDL